jgi:hypothetical protein
MGTRQRSPTPAKRKARFVPAAVAISAAQWTLIIALAAIVTALVYSVVEVLP